MPQELTDFLLSGVGNRQATTTPTGLPKLPASTTPQKKSVSPTGDTASVDFLLQGIGGRGPAPIPDGFTDAKQIEDERKKEEQRRREEEQRNVARGEQLQKMRREMEIKYPKRSALSFLPESIAETFFPSVTRLLKSTGALNERQVLKTDVLEGQTVVREKGKYAYIIDTQYQDETGKFSEFSNRKKAGVIGGTIFELVAPAVGGIVLGKSKNLVTGVKEAPTLVKSLLPSAKLAATEVPLGVVGGALEAESAGEDPVKGGIIGGVASFLLTGAGSIVANKIARDKAKNARELVQEGERIFEEVKKQTGKVVPSSINESSIYQEARKYKSVEEFKLGLKAIEDKTGENVLRGGRFQYHVTDSPSIDVNSISKEKPLNLSGSGPIGSRRGYVFAVDTTKLPEGIFQPSKSGVFHAVNQPIPQEAIIPLGQRDLGQFNLEKAFYDKAKTQAVPPPVTLVGDLNAPIPKREGFAANINVQKFPEEIRAKVAELATDLDGAIQKQRRGVISDEAIVEAAKSREVLIEALQPGTILNAEDTQAGRVRSVDLALAAIDEAGNWVSEEARDLAKRGGIGLSGITAEPGRTLRVFRNEIEGAEQAAKIMLKLAEESTDPVEQEMLFNSAAHLSKGVQKVPGFLDKFVEAATAMKLTNLRTTPARAVVGNIFATMLRLPEEAATVVVGKTRSAIVGRLGGTPSQAKTWTEVTSEGAGMLAGFKEGMHQAAEYLINEGSVAKTRAIEEGVSIAQPAIGGVTGKVVRAPFRLLSAIDAPFRAANEKGSMMALATRKALDEGLSGEELVHRVADIIENPSKQFKKNAEDFGRQFVFQNTLEGIMKTFNDARAKHPILKIPIAFFKTPVDLARFTLKRATPLGLVMPSTIKEIRAGGISRDRAIARVTMGTIMSAGTTMMAAAGYITGAGPKDRNKRRSLERTGWQPYSIHHNGKYYSYSGFEPIATYLAIGAGIAENFIHNEDNDDMKFEEKAQEMIFTVMGNWTNQPFLTGLNDMLSAITDPGRNGENFVQSTVGGFVPTGLAELARQQDQYKRQAGTIAETVMSKIPFLREKLLPRQTVFGENVNETVGVLPFDVTQEAQDKTEDELIRLGVFPGMPSRTITGNIQMSDQEYFEFVQISGQASKALLDVVVNNGEFEKLSDEKKRDVIEDVITRTRREMKQEFIKDLTEKELQKQQ